MCRGTSGCVALSCRGGQPQDGAEHGERGTLSHIVMHVLGCSFTHDGLMSSALSLLG